MMEPSIRTIDQKWNSLLDILRGYGSAAIAFSGGVDSTFLLRAAKEALGDRTAAVTAVSALFMEREMREAEEFCRDQGIRQILCQADTDREEFRTNPPDRCYHCKKNIFGKVLAIAAENGLAVVCDGSNMDDLGDYRPGHRALKELGIRSPLREAGLYKEEIRELSRRLGLPTADKPSFACLASRFVYGETITEEKLRMVGRAEQKLMDLGFTQYRVRIHGRMARIEVLTEEMDRFLQPKLRREVEEYLRGLGFSYVTLDLKGFRSGSMNETLGNPAMGGASGNT